MLRRKPTVISLTPEDLSTYDERVAQEEAEERAAEAEHRARMELENQRNKGSSRGNSRDVTPVPREKNSGREPAAPGRRTREERLGIGRAL